ncbi:MAG: FG-GAP repeat protein [Myxococcaceae bacterium]|nr:FG-GAP repeat protein [Myxococcaceae bacterium]
MKRNLWALLLAITACEPTTTLHASPAVGTLRQPLPGGPPGTIGLSPPSSQPGDRFGHALAWGDFNKDGQPDLAVGAPGVSAGRGNIYVFYGPLDPQLSVAYGALFTTPSSALASTLAAGDFNADGVDDLAAGAPGWSNEVGSKVGAVAVFRGQEPAGLSPTAELIDPTSLGLGEGARFGGALVGVPGGLWVGAPGGADAGYAVLYTAQGAGSPLSQLNVLSGAPSFGTALLPLDLDGSNRLDLAVGVPAKAINRGAVATFISSGNGFTPGIENLGSAVLPNRSGSVLLRVGSRVVVGAPAGLGYFQVAIPLASGAFASQAVVGSNGGDFAAALEVSDLDNDGAYELYVGAPGVDAVNRYLGINLSTQAPALASLSGRFGSALAGNVDALGDEAQELAVGATDYVDLDAGVLGGAVFVFVGDAGQVVRSDGGMNTSDAGRADAGGPATDGGGAFGVSIELSTQADQTVTLTPLLSGPTPSTARFTWDFGDVSPLELTTTPTAVKHRYAVPGGYRVRLTVAALDNDVASEDVQVKIADRLGRQPPDARITNPGLVTISPGGSVMLNCVTSEPSAPVRWDVSTGPLAVMNPIVFNPPQGATRVHCYVQGANGLVAHDSVLVRNSTVAPNQCRLAFAPPAGALPLGVVHSAALPVALRPGATVTLENDTPLPLDSQFLYTTKGFHPVSLEAGLAPDVAHCTDRASVFTYEPLVLGSKPAPPKCGEALSWSVDAPDAEVITLTSATNGVVLDTATNTVTSPRVFTSQRLDFQLQLSNRFEQTAQDVSLAVTCDGDLTFSTCGCSAGAAGPAAALLLVALARRRRLSRNSSTPMGSSRP